MIGMKGDWSGDGRVNDVYYYEKVTSIGHTIVSNDWDLIGTATVERGSQIITATSSDFSSSFSRGDVIVVGEEVHYVDGELCRWGVKSL